MRNLENFREKIYICNRSTCGYCLYRCPEYHLKGIESYGARGRMHIARGLLEGRLEPDASLVDRISSCLSCGYCTQRCGFDLTEIFETLKQDLVEQGKVLEKYLQLGGSIKENHNPYFKGAGDRFEEIRQEMKQDEDADLLYFVGCASAYQYPTIARSTFMILNKLEINYQVLNDEWCCGFPLIRTGQIGLAKEVAEYNLEAIKALGANRVVFSCAECYRTFAKDYAERLGLETDFESLHISELLSKQFKKSEPVFKGKLEEKVAYHDPCHLGRHMERYQQSRDLLGSVPGLELVEMEENRESARCCGAGGEVVRSGYPEVTLELAKKRIEEAEACGAEIIASSCPICYGTFKDAVKNTGAKLKVKDVTEIISEVI